MSLIEKLKAKKEQLKATDTKIRYADGTQMIVRSSGDVEQVTSTAFGFVVDTKPDPIPAEILKRELFLGSQDSVDLETLQKYNIGAVLSVGIECPIELPETIRGKFIPCLDLPEANFESVLDESIEFIKRCNELDLPVLVHCNAGVSRSSTVVIGYLIKECRLPFEEAFRAVKLKRSAIQPNAGFLQFLKALK